VAACENISNYCGAIREITLENIGDTFIPSINAIPKNFSCTYSILAQCGAPMMKFTGSAGSSDIELTYIHFTHDSRTTMDEGYPVANTNIYDATDYCTASATSSFCDSAGISNSVTYIARTQDSGSAYIQLSQITSDFDAY